MSVKQLMKHFDGVRVTSITTARVKIYINHRLLIAGYRGAPLFTNSALKLLHRNCRGIPRLANVGRVARSRSSDPRGPRRCRPNLAGSRTRPGRFRALPRRPVAGPVRDLDFATRRSRPSCRGCVGPRLPAVGRANSRREGPARDAEHAAARRDGVGLPFRAGTTSWREDTAVRCHTDGHADARYGRIYGN